MSSFEMATGRAMLMGEIRAMARMRALLDTADTYCEWLTEQAAWTEYGILDREAIPGVLAFLLDRFNRELLTLYEKETQPPLAVAS